MASAGLVGRSFSSDIRYLRRKTALALKLKSLVYLEDFCRTYPSFVRVKKSDPQISLRVGFFSADFKHGALRFHAIQPSHRSGDGSRKWRHDARVAACDSC